MYRFFLSLRILRHHWLMTLIGSFFVGASLLILVVVMSVMDGFQAKLKETLAGSSADLQLTPRWPCDPVLLAKTIEELVPEVVAAGPFDETVTLTRKAGRVDALREKMHYAAVFGIDPAREARINKFTEYLSPLDRLTRLRGKPSVRDVTKPFKVHSEIEEATGTVGVVIGKVLAAELGVFVNDKIRIAIAEPGAAQDENDDSAAPKELSLKYVQVMVVGYYESGNTDVDRSCVFMDHAAFARMFTGETARVSVRCRLTDPEEALDPALDRLKSGVLDELVRRTAPPGVALEPWQMQMRHDTWKDQNRAIVQAIESEKSMILVIVFLIVVAGTSSIFAAQWLLVSDKVREIGILRALGAEFGGVVSIFVLNGFLMGVIGSACGALGGLLVVHNIDIVHGWISTIFGRPVFDPNVYLFPSIPTLVDYGEVTRYAVAALVCALVASAIPAMRAGFMNPAQALHRD
jgi:lipoprotein-releasing system permease protein